MTAVSIKIIDEMEDGMQARGKYLVCDFLHAFEQRASLDGDDLEVWMDVNNMSLREMKGIVYEAVSLGFVADANDGLKLTAKGQAKLQEWRDWLCAP
jgi:hypothetical protein